MVARKKPRRLKPRKPTDAQQRKSILARNARINARPRAEIDPASDDCCTDRGALWTGQQVPCWHDCHYPATPVGTVLREMRKESPDAEAEA